MYSLHYLVDVSMRSDVACHTFVKSQVVQYCYNHYFVNLYT